MERHVFQTLWRLRFRSLKGDEFKGKGDLNFEGKKEIQEETRRSEETTKEFYRIPYLFFSFYVLSSFLL